MRVGQSPVPSHRRPLEPARRSAQSSASTAALRPVRHHPDRFLLASDTPPAAQQFSAFLQGLNPTGVAGPARRSLGGYPRQKRLARFSSAVSPRAAPLISRSYSLRPRTGAPARHRLNGPAAKIVVDARAAASDQPAEDQVAGRGRAPAGSRHQHRQDFWSPRRESTCSSAFLGPPTATVTNVVRDQTAHAKCSITPARRNPMHES